MRRSLIVLLLALPFSLCAQDRLGLTLPVLKKELDQFVTSNPSLKPVLQQGTNELSLRTSNIKGEMIQFVYVFDDSTGTCIQEKTISSCKPCYQKLLDELLGKKQYEWKKINESQYVSRFNDYLMIEMQESGKDLSFTLLKTAWTPALYELMLQN